MTLKLTEEPVRIIVFERKAKRFSLKVLEGILNCIPVGVEFHPTEVAELLTGLGHYMPPDNICILLTELANNTALPAFSGVELLRTSHRPPKFRFADARRVTPAQEARSNPDHGPATHRLERMERMLELLLKNLGVEVPS